LQQKQQKLLAFTPGIRLTHKNQEAVYIVMKISFKQQKKVRIHQDTVRSTSQLSYHQNSASKCSSRKKVIHFES